MAALKEMRKDADSQQCSQHWISNDIGYFNITVSICQTKPTSSHKGFNIMDNLFTYLPIYVAFEATRLQRNNYKNNTLTQIPDAINCATLRSCA